MLNKVSAIFAEVSIINIQQKYCISLNNHLIYGLEGQQECDISLSKKFINTDLLFKNCLLQLLRLENSLKIAFPMPYHQLIKKLIATFGKITAAGGIVFNQFGEILLIHRQGKWDLPKGKIEKKENLIQGAIREVSEECKLKQKDLYVVDFIDTTYHLFYRKDKMNVKESVWYKMLYAGNDIPIPQAEEDIIEATFVPLYNLKLEELDTFYTIKQLLKSIL